MTKQIITISREFGSGGRLIGKKLAEKLDVPYYDKGILDQIAKENGYSAEMMEEDEKKAKNGFLYSLSNAFGTAGYGPDTLSINEKFFIAQFEYITKLAEEGNGGVIVGRCADYVLRDRQDVINVFVYAEEEDKIERAVNVYDTPRENIARTMKEVDKARAHYYKYHTGKKWGEPTNYDLCINSTAIDIDDIVSLIMEFINIKNKKAEKE